ncbi:glycosyltransferase [Aeromonas dhakensis]|uniref:glycosyltransferase n=1 Tax=Aeromonas dhakensis TaxID=196024 RepID=UPI0038D19446
MGIIAHYFNMKARQKKKSIKKNITTSASSQLPTYINGMSFKEPRILDEKHILILKEQLEKLHNEVRSQKEQLLTISNLSQKKQYDYLRPLISENKQLAASAEKNGLNKTVFNALKEQVYILERQKHELQVELEREKERTFKTKNSISFLLGNTLIMYRKNNESLISLFRKLAGVNRIAKDRRNQNKVAVQPCIPFKRQEEFSHEHAYSKLKLIFGLSESEYISLDKVPTWFSFTPTNTSEVVFRFYPHKSEVINYKDILARVVYLNSDGNEIDGAIPGTYISSTVGRYVYLDVLDNEKHIELKFTPPSSATSILVGLQIWDSKSNIRITNAFDHSYAGDTENLLTDEPDYLSLKDGVSVIIPSYKGNDTIPDMLQAILHQTFPKSLMQLVVIINGDDTSSLALYKEFKEKNRDIDVIVHHDATPSASNARNIAIGYADRKYTVFLDNDDMLTENYIQALYDRKSPDSIVICGIHDINEQGNLIKDNSANNQYLLASVKPSISYNDVTAITTMIACKLLPTHKLKKVSFVPHLRSGEDVVFFCDYMSKFKPKIIASPEKENAFYIRRITQNSVSRQKSTFDFCVRQRLQVIKELKSLQEHSNDKEQLGFIQSKINAQCTFIKNFLNESPEYKEELILELKTLSLEDFSYEVINRGKSKSLVISYCFPPYVDTSACVMAKRLRAEGEIVDVVHNNMSKVRNVSNDLNLLVNDLIEQRKIVNTPSTFANWSGIYSFALETLKWATRKQSNYEKIYSRAMWPASHYAAFLVKKEKPELKWTAEFSDPILWDIKSQERYSKLDLDFIKNNVLGLSRETDTLLLQYQDNDNLYFWCEILPYIFADEIIFTCTNQRDYMLSMVSDSRIKDIVISKSCISQHPTLSPFYYSLGNADYQINDGVKNIGYFGAFYAKRNLDDVVQALKAYKNQGKKDIVLHVFTEQVEEAVNFVHKNELSEYIIISGYLAYLDFLKVITKFDCLIVNDSIVEKEKGINPYLPSKLSDYVGTDSNIWAIFEPGSALSNMNRFKFMSKAGDTDQALFILNQISAQN